MKTKTESYCIHDGKLDICECADGQPVYSRRRVPETYSYHGDATAHAIPAEHRRVMQMPAVTLKLSRVRVVDRVVLIGAPWPAGQGPTDAHRSHPEVAEQIQKERR